MTTQQNFDSSHLEVPASLYRVKNRRQKKTKKRFVERPFIDLFLLFSLPASAWLLLALFRPAFDIGNIAAQLDSGAIILGVPALILSMVAWAWRLRWRINHYQPWWNDACPKCESSQLKRKRRHQIDHWIGRVGIPIRRYICANCSWQGRLVDETRVF